MFDYAKGHVETVQEYIDRGGVVTYIRPYWSRHLTDDATMVAILCGGTDEDGARGYATADLPIDLRECVNARRFDSLHSAGEE